MFVVLGKKIARPEGAVRHFFKKRGRAVPFIHDGDIDAIPEDKKADHEWRRKDQERFYKSTYPSGQHRTELTQAC